MTREFQQTLSFALLFCRAGGSATRWSADRGDCWQYTGAGYRVFSVAAYRVGLVDAGVIGYVRGCRRADTWLRYGAKQCGWGASVAVIRGYVDALWTVSKIS